MCVCVYVCVCVHTYIYIYIYIYVHVYIYIYIYRYIYIYMYYKQQISKRTTQSSKRTAGRLVDAHATRPRENMVGVNMVLA